MNKQNFNSSRHFVTSLKSIGMCLFVQHRSKLKIGINFSLGILVAGLYIAASPPINHNVFSCIDPPTVVNEITICDEPEIPVADLEITKDVDNNNPFAGENLLFTFTISNNGPAAATNVEIEASFDSCLTNDGANENWTSTPAGATTIISGAINPGQTITIELTLIFGPFGDCPVTCKITDFDQEGLLEVECPTGTVSWYNTDIGGIPIATGEQLNPLGTTAEEGNFMIDVAGTYTYYAECGTDDGCVSERVKVVVTIPPLFTDCTCPVDGGTLSTTSSTTICGGDGNPDIIDASTDGSQVGDNFGWLITDAATRNILSMGVMAQNSTTFSPNLDGLPVGTCNISIIAWNGTLTGADQGSNIAGITSDKCFDLSDAPISVTREDCTCTVDGGSLSTASSTTICGGDGSPDIIDASTDGSQVGYNFGWLITDAATRNILSMGVMAQNSTTFSPDLDGLPVGTCNISIIAWNGTLTGADQGSNIAGITSDECFDLSDAPISVTREDCTCTVDGGSLSTASSTTICGGDGIPDIIDASTDGSQVGDNFGWLITDAATGNILSMGVMAQNSTNFSPDLDGLPVGTCNISIIAWNGTLTGADQGSNITDIASDECFDLSDAPISVTKGISPQPIPGGPYEGCAGVGISLDGASLGGSATMGAWMISNSPIGGDGNVLPMGLLPNPSVAVFTASVAGDYTLTLTTDDPDGSCTSTSQELIVTVHPLPVASPAMQEVCIGDMVKVDGNPSQGTTPYKTHTWIDLGTGTADPAGYSFIGTSMQNLVVDASDATNAQAGTIELEYTVIDDNGCTQSETARVTINQLDDAAFSYDGVVEFCRSMADPIAIITGSTGGIFSAMPTDLAINTTTGEIDIAASSEGSYSVTYTTTGICPQSMTINIDIVDEVSCMNGMVDDLISFKDPCDCSNPLNCFSPELGDFYFHDILRIPATGSISPNLDIRITASTDFYVDVNCLTQVFTEPTLGTTRTQIPEVSQGVYEIEFWRTVQLPTTLSISADNGMAVEAPASTFDSVCECLAPIPTMGEWGLLCLGLLLMIVSANIMKQEDSFNIESDKTK